jgi:hypothetical protein
MKLGFIENSLDYTRDYVLYCNETRSIVPIWLPQDLSADKKEKSRMTN